MRTHLDTLKFFLSTPCHRREKKKKKKNLILTTLAPSCRREIHEIEKRKRERRKKRLLKQKQEEHDRQERMMRILEKNPMLAYNMQNGQLPAAFPSRSAGGPPMPAPAPKKAGRDERYGGPPPPPDLSGNPYASSAARYR